MDDTETAAVLPEEIAPPPEPAPSAPPDYPEIGMESSAAEPEIPPAPEPAPMPQATPVPTPEPAPAAVEEPPVEEAPVVEAAAEEPVAESHPLLRDEPWQAMKAWVRAELLHMQLGKSEQSRKLLNP